MNKVTLIIMAVA